MYWKMWAIHHNKWIISNKVNIDGLINQVIASCSQRIALRMIRILSLALLLLSQTRAESSPTSELLEKIDQNDRLLGLKDCKLDKDCPDNFPFCRNNQFALSLGIKEGPFAEKIGKRCYQCRKDSQCADPTAFCVDGLCRQCKGDVDCPADTSVCFQNDCVQCNGNQAFNTTEECQGLASACAREGLFQNQCVQCAGTLDGCNTAFSTACSSVFTPFTSNSTFPSQQPFCIQCLEDRDCSGSNKACDPVDLQCKGCLVDQQCSGPQPVCDTDRNTCVQCLNSTTDCSGATPVCLNATSKCVQCEQASDCANSTLPGFLGCLNNTCAYNCTANEDCLTPNHPFCDTSIDVCVECRNSTDCDDQNKVCLGGSCVMCVQDSDCYTTTGHLFCNNTTNTCVACRSNADCNSPTGVCDLSDPLAPVCRQCLADTDCPSDSPKCDLTSNVRICVPT